jgi:2-iminobutanoate/2-iminopropanoate deaminase
MISITQKGVKTMSKKTLIILTTIALVASFATAGQQAKDDACCKAKMGKQILAPKGAGLPGVPFSPGVKVGPLVFLSGVIPLDPATKELVSPDIAGQTKACLEQLAAVLKEADMTLSDSVKVTVYLTDLKDFPEMNKVYATYFPENPPARECVQVAALVKGAKIELSLIAVQIPKCGPGCKCPKCMGMEKKEHKCPKGDKAAAEEVKEPNCNKKG